MIYKLVIPYLIEEEFETDENIQPLSSNIVDWSIDPDVLEIVIDPDLDALKTVNVDVIDYLSNTIDGFSLLTKTDTTIDVVGSDSFSVNDIVWCENEPMTITYKNSSTNYTVERLYPRTHVYNGAISKDRPLNIIGCFGYIQDESNVKVKWIYIEELTTSGSGAILNVSDILKMFDMEYPFNKPNLAVKYIKNAYTIMQEAGMLNFVSNLGQISDYFYIEDWESSTYFVSANPFEIMMKSAKLRGYIIRYNNNSEKYSIIKISQPSLFNPSIPEISLDDNINYSGGYEFQALAGGVKVAVKSDLFKIEDGLPTKGESIEFNFNFGSTFNQYQEEIELDLSSIVAYDGITPIYDDKYRTIIFFKQLINSGVASVKSISYGLLKINRIPDAPFEVGNYYKITDAHRFELFIRNDVDVYLLCVKNDGYDAEFLVLNYSLYSPVAPTILVKYIGEVEDVGSYCVKLVDPYNSNDDGNLSDYLKYTGSNIQNAQLDEQILYEDLLGIQLFPISNPSSVYTKSISTISGNTIALSSSTNMILNKEYILRRRYVSPNTVTSKFLHYLSTGGGNV